MKIEQSLKVEKEQLCEVTLEEAISLAFVGEKAIRAKVDLCECHLN